MYQRKVQLYHNYDKFNTQLHEFNIQKKQLAEQEE